MDFYLLSDVEREKIKLKKNFEKELIKLLEQDKLSGIQYTLLDNYLKNGETIININTFVSEINKIDDGKLFALMKDISDKTIKIKKNKIKPRTKKLLTKIKNDKKNVIKFTSDQQKAIKKILTMMQNENEKVFGLYGFAGTGKTTLLVELVSYLIKEELIHSIVFSAPTHKALKVIKGKFKPYLHEIYKRFFDKDPLEDMTIEMVTDKLYEKNIKIDFVTIHKLLKFERDFDISGEAVYVKSKMGSLINQYELVIVDECSMVAIKMINELFNELREISNPGKMIFSGDPAQLPPVNEKVSSVFAKDMNNLDLQNFIHGMITNNDSLIKRETIMIKNESEKQIYQKMYDILMKDLNGFNTIIMKKVMRNNSTNIIKLCNKLRKWIFHEIEKPGIGKYEDNEKVFIYQNTKSKKTETKWFKKFAKYHKDGNNECIIITWTNKQADDYNSEMRKILFGSKVDAFETNDILILNDYYNLGDESHDYIANMSSLKTSEQVKIINRELIMKDVSSFNMQYNATTQKIKNFKNYDTKCKIYLEKINENIQRKYRCWKLSVQKTDSNTSSNIHNIYVLHKDEVEKHDKDIKLAYTIIKELKKTLIISHKDKIPDIEHYIIKPLWKLLYDILIKPFANVNYGYAITCHKAQGSNFGDVFVDCNDILSRNSNIDEARKCLYTAVTRTSDELHLLY